MSNPGRGAWRIGRGAVLALSSAGLAAGGHLVAGGGPPPTATLLVTAAVIGGAFVVLAGRRRHLGEIAAYAAAAQVGFHVAFAVSAPADASGGHHGVGAAALDLGMLLGHLVAAVVMAWLLAHGEATVWALWRAWSFVARRPELAPMPPMGRPAALPVDDRGGAPSVRVEWSVQRRRGPPVAPAR